MRKSEKESNAAGWPRSFRESWLSPSRFIRAAKRRQAANRPPKIGYCSHTDNICRQIGHPPLS
jgi:hypothetical protein